MYVCRSDLFLSACSSSRMQAISLWCCTFTARAFASWKLLFSFTRRITCRSNCSLASCSHTTHNSYIHEYFHTYMRSSPAAAAPAQSPYPAADSGESGFGRRSGAAWSPSPATAAAARAICPHAYINKGYIIIRCLRISDLCACTHLYPYR